MTTPHAGTTPQTGRSAGAVAGQEIPRSSSSSSLPTHGRSGPGRASGEEEVTTEPKSAKNVRPVLHLNEELVKAAASASDLVRTLARGRDYLLAERGPGDFIGEMALIGGSGLRRACSVRVASEEVRVAVIPYALAKEHFRKHPEAKQRLAEVVWARQSETIVLEALLRLAAARDELCECTPS